MGISRRSGTWPTWKCGNPSNRKTLKKTGSLTFWSSLTWKKSKRKPNDAVSTRPWKCGAKIWQSPTVQMGTSGLYHRKMVEFWPEKNWASPANTGRSVIFSLYGWGCDLKQEQAVTLRTSMVNHVQCWIVEFPSPCWNLKEAKYMLDTRLEEEQSVGK